MKGTNISVIIPTRNRPELLYESVQSVLAQTGPQIEAIVVADGSDHGAVQTLTRISDPRLRLLRLPESKGPAAARNLGISHAAGDWIAFLDDDDLYLPEKLARQWKLAQAGGDRIVACRVVARNESGDHVWPRRAPGSGEPLSEYLFCRTTPFSGEGIVQLCMLMVPKSLAAAEPFCEDLFHLEDLEWLLRITQRHGAHIEFTPAAEPLAIWRIEGDRDHLSYRSDWQEFLTWARRYRDLLTPRAFGAFVLTWAGFKAARGRVWKAFFPLLREALRDGKPSGNELLAYFTYWLVPSRLASLAALHFGRARENNFLR